MNLYLSVPSLFQEWTLQVCVVSWLLLVLFPSSSAGKGCPFCTQPSQTPFLYYFAAQRSAQELPQVEAYSPSACSVRGGEELVLTGSNFLPDSKVVFIERGPGEYPLRRGGE